MTAGKPGWRSRGLPWKHIQGFAGGSDAANQLVILYCSIRSRDDNGLFRGGLYFSVDPRKSQRILLGAADAVIHVTTSGGGVWRGPDMPSEP